MVFATCLVEQTCPFWRFIQYANIPGVHTKKKMLEGILWQKLLTKTKVNKSKIHVSPMANASFCFLLYILTLLGSTTPTCEYYSLLPRPSHCCLFIYFTFFDVSHEKLGWPGQWSGDVCGFRHDCVSPPTHPCSSTRLKWWPYHCVGEWAEIHNCVSNRVQLYHQIDQTFLSFLMNRWKALVQGWIVKL